MGWRLVVTAILLAAPLLRLGSQQLPPLQTGNRVRVRLRPDVLIAIPGGRSRFTVFWEGVAGDSLVVRRPQVTDGRLAVPSSWVIGLEISRGRRTGALAGAVIGGVAGTALAVTALAGRCQCWVYPGVPLHWPMLALYGLAGGALGTGVGGIVGAQIRFERWEAVRW
jgi:hypothetical protein